MATNFSAGLDSYLTKVDNVTATAAADINDPQDAIEAIEAKIGVDNSAVNTTLDYFLKHATGAYRIHHHDGSSDDGAQLDWDNCWIDAIHTHVSAAEGGQVSLTAAVTGTLPTINGGTGSIANANAASGVVVLDASSKLPAVDGSLLTNIGSTSAFNISTGHDHDGTDSKKLGAIGMTSIFGAWASKSNNTAYLAATDGFVCAYTTYTTAGKILYGYTDNANPPVTCRIWNTDDSRGGYGQAAITMPVRKNDYWKVTGANTVYWIPLGS